MVTGIAAMLKMLNPALTPLAIKTLLRDTGDPAPAAVGGIRVNACAAVQSVLQGQGLTIPPLLECSRGGLVRTGGGDAQGLAKPGAGGAVDLRVGLAVDTALFAGATQPLIVPLGETHVLTGDTTHAFTTIEIDGELKINGQHTILAATGPVSLLGKITVRRAAGNRHGGKLTLVSVGRVFLQGEIDTTGRNGMASGTAPQAGGVGGGVTLRTQNRAAFTVPTIITRGGDAALTDMRAPATTFPGGNGGEITIAARSVLLRFAGQTLDETMVDPLPPDLTGVTLPLTTLFRRGLLTTGGFGGFYKGPNNTLTAGAAGGHGGAIQITCLEHTPGAPVPLRFQDTALFTGGDVDTTLGVPTLVVFHPGYMPITVLLKQRPGSLGGRGARGTNKNGGDGGAEGNGGDVLLTACAPWTRHRPSLCPSVTPCLRAIRAASFLCAAIWSKARPTPARCSIACRPPPAHGASRGAVRGVWARALCLPASSASSTRRALVSGSVPASWLVTLDCGEQLGTGDRLL